MKKIVVGIHEELDRGLSSYFTRYEKVLSYNNIKSLRLNVTDFDFWQKIRGIDYFIYRWVHLDSESQIARAILPIVGNEYKIPCFPNQATCWHYDDKIKQYYLMKAHNFPMIETWIFWDQKSVLKWIKSATYPLVFKLKGGAGSSNVVLVQNIFEATKIVKKMFSKNGMLSNQIPIRNNLTFLRNITQLYSLRRFIAYKRGRIGPEWLRPFWQIHRDYVLFQRFLPNNKYDTRITIIGNRAFVFKRHVRPGDFRASGSGIIDYDTSKIDKRCLEIAYKISNKLNFQSMAYDFVYNEKNEPEIAEISYTFMDTAVYKCPGYFDEDINWHEGHFWPQFCQLADLISEVDLKQPPEDLMFKLSTKHIPQEVPFQ